MAQASSESNSDEGWGKFIRKHWGIFAIFILAVIVAAVWAVYVFLWFVGNAQSTGMVPSTLGLWTMNNLVTFIIYTALWEIVLVGVPVAIAAIAGWLWWRRLPVEERREYQLFGGRNSRARNGGSAVSFLLFIVFCIKVYIDGKWNAAISTFTLNYVVYSLLTILVWGAVIFGIPLIIVGIWWIFRERRKP